MKALAYLIVNNGAPFEQGAFIPLEGPAMIIGRKVKDWQPELAFQNIYVSRRHLEIRSEEGKFFMKDLGSKHGTFLNKKLISAHQEFVLADGDIISLANQLISFSFVSAIDDHTADLTPLLQKNEELGEITLDSEKHELTASGQSFLFSEKEFKCLEKLVQCKDQFVSVVELKKSVWPERVLPGQEALDVSSEEINALLYRIRKKTKPVIKIETIRGKGYILSCHSEQAEENGAE